MERSNFIKLIKNESDISQSENINLNSILKKHPYFQSARALYLKGLKNQDSFKYNKELKITAAYTNDRSILFEYITSKSFNEVKKDFNVDSLSNNSIPDSKNSDSINKTKNDLGIGKPINFKSSENYSFNQWLQLSINKQVVDKTKNTPTNKELIINKFIKENPRISPIKKDTLIKTEISSIKEDSELMTQTLAKVYLEQKKYENAIQAYKILSLKYPEKSGFFADQIKKIKILQKHKS